MKTSTKLLLGGAGLVTGLVAWTWLFGESQATIVFGPEPSRPPSATARAKVGDRVVFRSTLGGFQGEFIGTVTSLSSVNDFIDVDVQGARSAPAGLVLPMSTTILPSQIVELA
jgi:hypothetical protein